MVARAALLVLFSGWASAQSKAPEPGALVFSVIDAITKRPIAGAEVILTRADAPGPPASGATSPNGIIEFSRLTPGQYRIGSVSAPHYTFDAYFAPPRVAVVSSRRTDGGTLELQPHGSIQGTIRDEDGRPVRQAMVEALRHEITQGSLQWTPAKSTQADEEGNFQLTDIAPGTYVIRAGTFANIGPSFQPIYYPAGENPGQALQLALSAGAVLDRIDVRLRPIPRFHVRGVVAGTKGDPEGLTVLAQGCTEGGLSLFGFSFAATRAAGVFDIASLAPGTYCISVQEKDKEQPLSFAREFVTVTDRDAENVRLNTAPPLELFGKITAGEGVALPESISLHPIGPIPAPPVEVVIEEDGRFHAGSLLPIEYRLGMRPARGSDVRSIRWGREDHSVGTLKPLQTDQPLDIEVRNSTSRVSGRVQNGTRAGIFVSIVPAGPLAARTDLHRTALTNERGEFSVALLPPGTYKVVAWERPEVVLLESASFANALPGATVAVKDGEEVKVEIRVLPAREVENLKGTI